MDTRSTSRRTRRGVGRRSFGEDELVRVEPLAERGDRAGVFVFCFLSFFLSLLRLFLSFVRFARPSPPSNGATPTQPGIAANTHQPETVTVRQACQ